MDNVKLVHITTVPFSLVVFFSGQVGWMKRHGFDVHAIASPGDLLDTFSRHCAVPVHAVPMSRRITPLADLVALWRLYRTLRKLRPHIVHAHTPKGGLLGGLAAWLAGVPVRVYTVHGLPLMTARGLKRRLLRWSERIACRCAHQVFAVGHSIGQVVVQEGICPAARIKVLLSGSIDGVDGAGRFNPARVGQEARRSVRRKHGIPQDAVVLGFVGRIVRDKGMIELAEAWRTLRAEFPSLHMLLAGPFEPQDPVPADVEALFRSDPRVHLSGHVAETERYYAAMDISVLPSYREGLPVAPLEAAAMNVPVVATRIPGCVEAVVDGVTGTLVPCRAAAALAAALRRYVSDPELRRQHGQAGRQRVLRDFQAEAIRRALYEEYVHLLQDKGLSTPDRGSEASTSPDFQAERAA